MTLPLVHYRPASPKCSFGPSPQDLECDLCGDAIRHGQIFVDMRNPKGPTIPICCFCGVKIKVVRWRSIPFQWKYEDNVVTAKNLMDPESGKKIDDGEIKCECFLPMKTVLEIGELAHNAQDMIARVNNR